jgi:hypothetical protein
MTREEKIFLLSVAGALALLLILTLITCNQNAGGLILSPFTPPGLTLTPSRVSGARHFSERSVSWIINISHQQMTGASVGLAPY